MLVAWNPHEVLLKSASSGGGEGWQCLGHLATWRAGMLEAEPKLKKGSAAIALWSEVDTSAGLHKRTASSLAQLPPVVVAISRVWQGLMGLLRLNRAY